MSAIVFFILFIIPFIIAPFGVTAFEDPKVIVAEVSVAVLLFLRIRHLQSLVLSFGHWLLVVIVMLGLIDILFLRSSISFFGNAFRMQGVFLLWILTLFSYLSCEVSFDMIPWWVYLWFIVLETLEVLFLPLNASGRHVGSMGEPNATGAFMLFLWPFMFFGIKRFNNWKRLLVIFGLICVIWVLILTGSRSAIIGVVIQGVFMLLYLLKIPVKRIFVICLILLVLSFGLAYFEKDVLYENRLEVWSAGIFAGLDHPIMGGGFGNTEYLIHRAAVEHKLRIRFYYVDSAHNLFLDWFAQGGIVGLGIISTILYLVFKRFVSMHKIRNLILLLGILTSLCYNPASVVGLLGFWWLIGQGLG